MMTVSILTFHVWALSLSGEFLEIRVTPADNPIFQYQLSMSFVQDISRDRNIDFVVPQSSNA